MTAYVSRSEAMLEFGLSRRELDGLLRVPGVVLLQLPGCRPKIRRDTLEAALVGSETTHPHRAPYLRDGQS